MPCIRCDKKNENHHFHCLEVLTLHVRDLGGEKRVQALGDFVSFSVCGDCAEERYIGICRDRARICRAVLPFALIAIAGLAVTLFFLHGDGAFRLLGISMLAGGLLGAFGTAQKLGQKKRELLQMSREEALRACAWDCLIEGAPKKSDINDITYIPIDESTLARKNGDLMLLYDLLPEIARQAYDRIHALQEKESDFL